MLSSRKNMCDSRVRQNIDRSELTHVQALAEKFAVSIGRVKVRTEDPGCSTNYNLQNICFSTKFWLSVWIEVDKPRDRWLQELHIYNKLRFAK